MIQFVYPAALALLVLLVACSDGDDNDASATLSASSSLTTGPATPTGSPGSPTPIPATEIAIGDAVAFPDNVALIVETGGTHGPTGGFVRVYRRPDGSIAQDILFTIEQLNLPPNDDSQPPLILGFAMRPDASDMAVTVCVAKYCGGLGPAEEGAVATLYRSLDGGVTWHEWADWPLDHGMIGLVGDGVLAGHWTNIPQKPDPDTTPSSQWAYDAVVLPEGRLIEQPVAANPAVWPIVTEVGEVWWPADNGRLLRDDGSVVLVLPDPGANIGRVRGHLKSGLLVDWREASSDDFYLTLYAGSYLLEPATAHLTVKSTGWLVAHAGPWPLSPEKDKGSTLYGNLDAALAGIAAPTMLNFGLVPALIDPDKATARPILSPFIDGTSILPNARNRVIAVQQGPFARVTGTGSCLNVRAEPSSSGEVLTCLADGVLLRDFGHTADDADGRTWLEVGQPSGFRGWVSTAFLER